MNIMEKTTLKEIEVKNDQGEILNLEEKRTLLIEIQERESQINTILDEYNNMEDKQSRAEYIDTLRKEYKRISKELYKIHTLIINFKK
jgi:formylmethanofuran dehydrogenase subunit A